MVSVDWSHDCRRRRMHVCRYIPTYVHITWCYRYDGLTKNGTYLCIYLFAYYSYHQLIYRQLLMYMYLCTYVLVLMYVLMYVLVLMYLCTYVHVYLRIIHIVKGRDAQ